MGFKWEKVMASPAVMRQGPLGHTGGYDAIVAAVEGMSALTPDSEVCASPRDPRRRTVQARLVQTAPDKPPSKLIATPVIYAACGETRNATRAASSSASAIRPAGTPESRASAS